MNGWMDEWISGWMNILVFEVHSFINIEGSHWLVVLFKCFCIFADFLFACFTSQLERIIEVSN